MVVAHSEFVAGHVRTSTGRDRRCVLTLPLPAPKLAAAGVNRLPPGEDRTAIGFGVMKRRYKGANRVESLAATGVPGWRFAIAGVGSPAGSPSLISLPGYLDAGDLAATVGGADSALMPYRRATQSGAIPFAQSVGAVPIATAVGGVVEQIRAGCDGILIPPGAGFSAWRDALEMVAADGPTLAANGRDRAERLDREFRALAAELL